MCSGASAVTTQLNRDNNLQVNSLQTLEQECQTHFHRGPPQPRGCLQKA